MQRILRTLVKILSWAALALAALVAALWVRSYWANDGWLRARPGEITYLRTGRGRVMVMAVERDVGVYGSERVRWAHWQDWERHPDAPGVIAMTVNRDQSLWLPVRRYAGEQDYLLPHPDPNDRFATEPHVYRLTVVSYWFPFVVCLAAASPLLLRTARGVVRHCWPPRRTSGHCARCGYDLRATPERCPECGERTRGAADSHGGLSAGRRVG